MPQVIDHIDKIARDKKRDVLYVIFHKDAPRDFDYEKSAARKKVLAWLDNNQIAYQLCGDVAREDGWAGYRGQIYIDVPFDDNDLTYQKLREFLENPDGTMKIPGVDFCYLPLDHAMKNAHHDEPGFWERWAENF
jgi:hypothetical protein